ncbi:recombination regulator RecX [Leuconostoc litchii]|uniref:Regulatory protein RecX n=1 Tax=Leuconostoc litchii TaxID=1981069 RepID=A0A6P2CN13_9LACO|nr:recombination regulator RecX [Leuconostoc litchii]TYC47266.1 recombination regulator RecX [Leuconostoc litchii]
MKKITKIATQNKAGRYSVYLDNQFAFGVAESVLIKFALAKGRELDEPLIDKIKHEDEISKALTIALNYLSHSLRTTKQVRQKMNEKEIAVDIQNHVIAQLQTKKYLNDLNYACHYVATKKKISPKGPNVIKRDLKQAGISEQNIMLALENYTDQEQIDISQKLAIKSANTYKKESTRLKKQKIMQNLAMKGFPFDIATLAVDRVISENDEETEIANIKRKATKIWFRYRNQSLSQRVYKTKNNLYQKGFDSEMINKVIHDLEIDESY